LGSVSACVLDDFMDESIGEGKRDSGPDICVSVCVCGVGSGRDDGSGEGTCPTQGVLSKKKTAATCAKPKRMSCQYKIKLVQGREGME